MAMARLLQRFAGNDLLTTELRSYLWTIMVDTPTGAKRLKALLPTGTIVAHKTGSSGTNASGMAAATNDVGIIVLPDGRRIAVAVFVSDSRAPEADRERVIALIARAVWSAFSP
jgi:beta-lactamase class A